MYTYERTVESMSGPRSSLGRVSVVAVAVAAVVGNDDEHTFLLNVLILQYSGLVIGLGFNTVLLNTQRRVS